MTTSSILLRACLACTVLVVIGFLDLPYGYYTFLRLCLCGAAVGIIYFAHGELHEVLLWGLGVLAVLYNPIIPVHFGEKSIWIVLNLLTISYFWALLGLMKYRNHNESSD